jgi:Sulfate permease family
VNDASGARSQLAGLVTAGVVALTLLVLAPAFSDLPLAVLGGIVLMVALAGPLGGQDRLFPTLDAAVEGFRSRS